MQGRGEVGGARWGWELGRLQFDMIGEVRGWAYHP